MVRSRDPVEDILWHFILQDLPHPPPNVDTFQFLLRWNNFIDNITWRFACILPASRVQVAVSTRGKRLEQVMKKDKKHRSCLIFCHSLTLFDVIDKVTCVRYKIICLSREAILIAYKLRLKSLLFVSRRRVLQHDFEV